MSEDRREISLIEACTIMQRWLCTITADGKSIPEALGTRNAR